MPRASPWRKGKLDAGAGSCLSLSLPECRRNPHRRPLTVIRGIGIFSLRCWRVFVQANCVTSGPCSVGLQLPSACFQLSLLATAGYGYCPIYAFQAESDPWRNGILEIRVRGICRYGTLRSRPRLTLQSLHSDARSVPTHLQLDRQTLSGPWQPLQKTSLHCLVSKLCRSTRYLSAMPCHPPHLQEQIEIRRFDVFTELIDDVRHLGPGRLVFSISTPPQAGHQRVSGIERGH